MKNHALLCAMLALFGLLPLAAPAHAQAQRTWVSGVGDDFNPCSRTAPCKTFAGAISKTAAGGEINVLDPGGYGGVTITKSITIAAESVEAGVLVSGTDGILVHGANIVVTLRGLNIDGVSAGLNGIVLRQAAALHVEKCIIRNFTQFGIAVTTSNSASLYVTGTTITGNGSFAAGGGISIKPTEQASILYGSITRTQILGNGQRGIKLDSSSMVGQGIRLDIQDSTVSGGAGHGIEAFTLPTGQRPGSVVMLDRVTVSNNAYTGVQSDGVAASVMMGGSVLTGNAIGLEVANAGKVSSFGTNQINGNLTANGVPTPGKTL